MKSQMKTAAFEARMSHPVGREFVPTLAHNELCKPKVVTDIGAIIAPISKDMVRCQCVLASTKKDILT